jgi:hypothetical protein
MNKSTAAAPRRKVGRSRTRPNVPTPAAQAQLPAWPAPLKPADTAHLTEPVKGLIREEDLSQRLRSLRSLVLERSSLIVDAYTIHNAANKLLNYVEGMLARNDRDTFKQTLASAQLDPALTLEEVWAADELMQGAEHLRTALLVVTTLWSSHVPVYLGELVEDDAADGCEAQPKKSR